MKRIGLDLMGGDNAPGALLKALKALKLPPKNELVLIGTAEYQTSNFDYVVAPTFVEMDEPPLAALRRKKEASMCIGLRLLKAGKIDALVSAGNTGALVSASKMILGNCKGLLRPALLAQIPTKRGLLAVLDVGANVQVKANHLVQFALLGAAFCRANGIHRPRVGLLNIGSEAMKGTSDLRQAYKSLSQKNSFFEFIGNIEGKSVFEGEANVLVTDGFTGNVFLKTAEGVASLILDRFDSLLPPEMNQQLHPRIEDLQRRLHYAEYPGALLAGVSGIVIKCHGHSSPQAIVNAVLGAADLASRDFIQSIKDQLAQQIGVEKEV
ncbi:MAG: phosphate acyltransferase PlsX [Verrucomicrobiota bacterium]|nr:phosphate acyltransferase PlsX [Verrucomicrobiota bacterium]